jgi:hypothetical protein
MPAAQQGKSDYPEAEKAGLITVIPKELRVRATEKHICQHCNKLLGINNTKYQLCNTCCPKLRNYGVSCSIEGCSTVCDGKNAVFYYKGKLVCYSCKAILRNYSLSFSDYQRLRNITNCQICNIELNHQHSRGNRKGACLDHDHTCCPTGGKSCGKCVRGVICQQCNTAEGYIKASGLDVLDWAHKLIDYLEQ